jgi:hypothetical protein
MREKNFLHTDCKLVVLQPERDTVAQAHIPVWQNQPELHRLKCADPFSEGHKHSTTLQMV